jgi:hypothetical protein
MSEQLAPTQSSLTDDLINDCYPPVVLDDTLVSRSPYPCCFSELLGLAPACLLAYFVPTLALNPCPSLVCPLPAQPLRWQRSVCVR